MFLFGFLVGLAFGCGLAYAAWRFVFGKPTIAIK